MISKVAKLGNTLEGGEGVREHFKEIESEENIDLFTHNASEKERQRFYDNGNQHLEEEDVRTMHINNKLFALGLQAFHILFQDVNWDKPFRFVVDYNPDMPAALIKRCYPKEKIKSIADLSKQISNEMQAENSLSGREFSEIEEDFNHQLEMFLKSPPKLKL